MYIGKSVLFAVTPACKYVSTTSIPASILLTGEDKSTLLGYALLLLL